ncbi:MAG TPA: LamB/YcsF family protein, partial [Thermoanaerobaculia bacterium]|nr:LamB/YcsF family protein [Thermoanaerobaculia bacterium]
ASFERATAEALLQGVADALPGADLLALGGSPFVSWARERGLRVLEEGFADRGYRPDGSLVPRGEPGALVDDPDEAASRAVRLAREGRVATADGDVALAVDTLCLHGDTPGAAARARAVRAALEAAGVLLVAV